MNSQEIEHITLEQLASICHEIGNIRVNGRPAFNVNAVNAHNDKVIGIDQIKQSGMVYIKIWTKTGQGFFAVWVDVPEPEAQQ